MQKPQSLRDLIGARAAQTIDDAPRTTFRRHPTWYPIFAEQANAVDNLANEAVRRVASVPAGEAWLRDIVPRLIDLADSEGAASALAELRAYGALLEADFQVLPIPRSKIKTPDFEIRSGSATAIVEVLSKQQDARQKDIFERVHRGETPKGVRRSTATNKSHKITFTEMESTPGGTPDPAKAGDSVQANLISRVCAIKGAESQIDASRPALLWIDFSNFGIWPEGLGTEQLESLISGHGGLTSGALWHAHYGWKGAPIFEEDFRYNERIVKMGHDGRFRLSGAKKSRFSGSILTMSAGVGSMTCFFENPWATCRLPDHIRRRIEALPWFDLAHSVCDWVKGDAEAIVQIKRREIETMLAWHEKLSALQA